MATFSPAESAKATLGVAGASDSTAVKFNKGINPSDTVPAESIRAGMIELASVVQTGKTYTYAKRAVTEYYEPNN